MKKIICFLVSALFLCASSFQVLATSEIIEYSNNSLSEEIVIYDCKSEKDFTEVVNYESVIPASELRSIESENERTLYSPEYVVEENTMTYEESQKKETRSINLQRISNPSSLGEYRSIVYIDIYVKTNNGVKQVSTGSGFMVGPNTVATAGHVINSQELAKLSSENNRWAYKAVVYPSKAGVSNPYGSATATNFISSSVWVNGSTNDETAMENDWGIIRLNKNIGDYTGWLGLKWTSSHYRGETIMYAGYPYGSPYNKYMYYGEGSQSSYKKTGLVYAKGTTAKPGQSGSPAYVYENDTGYTAIGIVTRSSTDGFGFVKLSEWLFNELISYRDQRANVYK